MNSNDKGRMARHLKNKAKKLSKLTGLPYHQCLNQVSNEAGNASYNDFSKKHQLTKSAGLAKSPIQNTLPKPLTLTYYMMTARNGAKRPNATVSVDKHLKMGKLLKEIYQATEYNNRARKAISVVRGLLDDWVQCEYVGQAELTDEVFFQMYYGDIDYPIHISPSIAHKAELVRKCYKVKGILQRGYHECKPVSELQHKLDSAIAAINAWPEIKRAKYKGVFKKRLIPGTFVYIKGKNEPLMVFEHSFRGGLVTAYGNSGSVVTSRNEISIYRDQSKFKNFRPMRLYLPYGKWTCSDGSEILYNRDYCPLWLRTSAGTVKSIDADFWVDYKYDDAFFNDGQAPWSGDKNKFYYQACVQVLKDWGVDEREPNLLKLLPRALSEGDTNLLRPKDMTKRYPSAI